MVRALFGFAWLAVSCTNSPYPETDDDARVLYTAFSEPPKTLDPAVAYSTADHAITGKVFDTLLEYHYLKRPYELIGGQAQEVPEPRELPDGRVEYEFALRPDLFFHDDPCFSASGGQGRALTARDFVFALQRLADPRVGSPVVEPFSHLTGFVDFGARLKAKRDTDPAFKKLPLHEQYEAIGELPGAAARGDDRLVVTLDKPYPQILYWFAMPFSSAVPWEAIEHYDGEGGRPDWAEHPVGSGPFVLDVYAKRSRMVLTKNRRWYGALHPEWRAPGAVFPSLEDATDLSDEDKARFAPLVGRPIPSIERIEYRREEESIPAFSKFLQGYYDMAMVVRESFNKVVHEGGLSAEMKERGMQLEKSVVPATYYIGFNMDDPVVGRAGGERARLLRQAMSLSIDVGEFKRLFTNGRGIPAQSPIPPGIYGYDEEYENPFRKRDEARARELLVKAGYPGGIDPKTKRPLRLTFDVPDTSPDGRLRYLFWTNQWRRLGIDVQLAATTYNKFQEKVRDGAYQIFQWGWVADYPDPENFLFLLTTPMARSVSGGPNTANFQDATYDALFDEMKTLENGPERAALIEKMRQILEQERPWIELFHPEEYALVQGWLRGVHPAGLSIPVTKYYDVEAERRAQVRASWNTPILWPLFAFLGALVALVVPGVFTFLKERQ